MSNESNLASLNKDEKTVLYYTKQGRKYEDIALDMDYSTYWVQLQMSNVYKKFGIPEEWHWKKKRDALNNDYFPLIPDSLDEFLALKEIKEDVEDTKPRKAVPRQQRNPYLIPFIIVICLLLTIVGGGVGYILYFGFPTPQVLVVSPTTGFTADISQTPLPSPTLEVIPPVVETDTPASTNTLEPTATVFVPPADGILFRDKFNERMKDDWTQITGTWLVKDGKLTKMPYTEGGWPFEWIAIWKKEWKNFVVSMDVDRPPNSDPDSVAIVVANRLGVQIDDYVFWGIIDDIFTQTTALSGEREYEAPYSFSIQIEVNNDLYKVSLNGRELQSITMSGYESDGIMIGIECESSTYGCTTIDNFVVNYLP